MPKHYVTFGQSHIHKIDNKVFDNNCVCVFAAKNHAAGRNKAVELFGDDFFTDYHDTDWDEHRISHFPRGYIILSGRIIKSVMSFDDIQKRIAEILSDERLAYPTATVFENAPLALIQLGLTTELHTLQKVLGLGLTNIKKLRGELS